MARPRKVMLLVDFDNVSPDVIEQAFHIVMAEYGAVHVRRAYCTADQAQQHAGFLKRLSLRPMVNLAVGKNSTDIALAVDAMDLVIAERPEVVVLVSSDSDYTPLVGRLREKGCWVRGFGQFGKTGDGVPLAYDEFGDLAHGDGRAAARRSERAPVRGAARPASAAPVAPAPRRDGRGGGEGRNTRPPREARALDETRAAVVVPNEAAVAVATEPVVAAPRGDRAAGSGRRRGRGGNAAERAARAAAREEMARLDAAADSAAEAADLQPPVVVEAVSPPPAAPLAVEPPAEAPAPRARRPARKTRSAEEVIAPAPALEEAPVDEPPAPAKPPRAAKTTPRPRAAAKKAAPLSNYPPAIEAILAAVPSLRSGEKIALGEAAQALREAELLARTAASTRLFKQHIDYFVLTPDRQPNQVQFRPPRED